MVAMGINDHGQCSVNDNLEKGIQVLTGLDPFKTADYVALGYFFNTRDEGSTYSEECKCI
jgi:hypothetical protein